MYDKDDINNLYAYSKLQGDILTDHENTLSRLNQSIKQLQDQIDNMSLNRRVIVNSYSNRLANKLDLIKFLKENKSDLYHIINSDNSDLTKDQIFNCICDYIIKPNVTITIDDLNEPLETFKFFYKFLKKLSII